MDLSSLGELLTIAATVGGVMVALGSGIWRAIARLDKRFDALEHAVDQVRHDREIERKSIEARIDHINYRIETELKYGVNANRELIEHKMQRVERAIQTLSGALERISDGRYVARGADAWPTDNPPPGRTGAL